MIETAATPPSPGIMPNTIPAIMPVNSATRRIGSKSSLKAARAWSIRKRSS